MFQTKLLLGSRAGGPAGPKYTIQGKASTNITTVGQGSSGSGSSLIQPTGVNGDFVLTIAGYSSTSGSMANGFYRVTPSGNNPGGSLSATLYDGKQATSSTPLMGGSAGWGSLNNNLPQRNNSGQVTYQLHQMVVKGPLPSTTKEGELFVTSGSMGATYQFTPTNVKGGTLFVVTVTIPAQVDFVIRGGEGTGQSGSGQPISAVNPMTNEWVCTHGPSVFNNNLTVHTFAYFRAANVTTSAPIVIQFLSSGTRPFSVGVVSLSTPEYVDNNPTQPQAPIKLTSPEIDGEPFVGQKITVSDGTWSATPPPLFAHQWYRNGVPIAGATSSVYVLTTDDDQANIFARVTASNSEGSASDDSNTIVPFVQTVGVTPWFSPSSPATVVETMNGSPQNLSTTVNCPSTMRVGFTNAQGYARVAFPFSTSKYPQARFPVGIEISVDGFQEDGLASNNQAQLFLPPGNIPAINISQAFSSIVSTNVTVGGPDNMLGMSGDFASFDLMIQYVKNDSFWPAAFRQECIKVRLYYDL